MPHRAQPFGDGAAAHQGDFALGRWSSAQYGYSHSRSPFTRPTVLRPDLHFTLEQNLVLFVNLLANDLDQLVDILRPGALMCHDEIGVLGADFRAADFQALQTGLIDQRAGTE